MLVVKILITGATDKIPANDLSTGSANTDIIK